MIEITLIPLVYNDSMNDSADPKWTIPPIPLPADDYAWDRLNNNLRRIAEVLAKSERRIGALEVEVEKLRAAVGVGNDKPATD